MELILTEPVKSRTPFIYKALDSPYPFSIYVAPPSSSLYPLNSIYDTPPSTPLVYMALLPELH